MSTATLTHAAGHSVSLQQILKAISAKFGKWLTEVAAVSNDAASNGARGL